MATASVADLTASTQNYLKAIWTLQEWSDDPVTAGRIAERVGVTTSTVSGSMAKLSEQGLVTHDPYGSVDLTAKGRGLALAMVRRHRLIETFLVEMLGYGWDEVHDEAENLEHAVSDFMIERLDEKLGRPRRDPHGDPIPDASGDVDRPAAVRLSEVEPGQRVLVERISDRDPDLLRFLHEQGVLPGRQVATAAGSPFSESISVTVAGSKTPVSLGRAATESVFVTLA